jgi:hypothetical protein
MQDGGVSQAKGAFIRRPTGLTVPMTMSLGMGDAQSAAQALPDPRNQRDSRPRGKPMET